jgi:hypothetical protein
MVCLALLNGSRSRSRSPEVRSSRRVALALLQATGDPRRRGVERWGEVQRACLSLQRGRSVSARPRCSGARPRETSEDALIPAISAVAFGHLEERLL